MTSAAAGPLWSRWLPAAALAEALPKAACEAALREWSQRWFATGGVRGDRWRPVAALLPGDDRGWVVGRQLRLVPSDGGAGRVAELMYGKPPLGDALTDADRTAVAAACERCLADLRLGLAKACGATGDWSSATATREDWAFALPLLSPAGEAIATLSIHRDLLARRRLADLPAPVRPPLATRASALAAQPVRLGVRIGAARLRLGDFGALRRGDVVLLDRAVAEPLDLTVGDAPVPVACRLVEAGEQLALHL